LLMCADAPAAVYMQYCICQCTYIMYS
jgi:hypothetical protein